MNVLSNSSVRAHQEQSVPLSVQDLPHHHHHHHHHQCPASGFSHLSSRLHPNAPMMLGLHSHGPQRSVKPQRVEMSPEEQQELRRKINSRERKRMQDLNVAMDALREVMVPYASSSPSSPSSQSHQQLQPGAPPGRRLSKISTLVLARNYILLLGSSLQEMRRLLGEVSVGLGMGVGGGGGGGPVPRLLLHTGGWPLISGPGQLLLTQESILSSASASASSSSSSSSSSSASSAKSALLSPGPMEASLLHWGSSAAGASGGPLLCSCGVCRLPRFSHHSTPAPRFPK